MPVWRLDLWEDVAHANQRAVRLVELSQNLTKFREQLIDLHESNVISRLVRIYLQYGYVMLNPKCKKQPKRNRGCVSLTMKKN